ncbi:hypothetical protein V1264_024054 [Littorina saxatilis]|uniref:PLAT domain-containing protein n=2 Tax=Littorina saxatilis TaxID=31220 RepID=A0AAN9B8J6_9CAEN
MAEKNYDHKRALKMGRLPAFVLLNCISFSQGFLLDGLLGPSEPSEKCYTGLGCFNNAPPFHSHDRAETYLPADLSAIGTKFILHTRETLNNATEEAMTVSSQNGVNLTHFSRARATKFIVHGFTHSARRQWVQDMVRELLKHDEMNVIVVDWEKGAQLPYGQAAANTRVVGAQVAQLIKSLVDRYDSNESTVHIIGHSLGAHIAGYTGERLAGLGRITGLDPSDPYFQNTPPQVRLDPSDAEFVDVVHTDGSSFLELGMGASQAMGHVDFYPNGGVNQPGCDGDLISKITHTAWNAATVGYYSAEGAVACSHLRALDLFTESINNPCPFIAYPCVNVVEFDKGHCLTCSGHGCSRLGYHANTMSGRGSLYLTTQDSSSFCSYHYQVNLTSENAVDGLFSVTLYGDKGHSQPATLTTKNEILNNGDTSSHLVTTRSDVGGLTGIGVRYDKSHTLLVHLLYADNWTLRSAAVQSGDTQQRSLFCAGGKTVPDDTMSVFHLAGNC